MKKRLLALFLCLTFIVSMFTGCGAGNDNPKLSPNSTLSDEELELIANADESGTWQERGEEEIVEWYYKDGTLIVVGTGKFGIYVPIWKDAKKFNYEK